MNEQTVTPNPVYSSPAPTSVSVAPASPASPVETIPQSAPVSTTASSAVAAPAPSAPIPAPKNNRLDRIFGIIAALFLFLGGVALAAWWYWDNQPEQVAMNAFTQLWSTPHQSVSGSVTFRLDDEDYNADIVLSSANNVSYPAQSGQEKLHFRLDLGDQNYQLDSLELHTAFARDGIFYLKLAGLTDLLDLLSAELPDLAIAGKLVASSNDQWWRLTVDEVIAQLKKDYPDLWDEDYEQAYETYTCTQQKYHDADLREFADLYRQYPFFVITPTDIVPSSSHPSDTWYLLDINAANFVAFYNSIPQSQTWQRVSSCYTDDDEFTFEPLELADVQEALSDEDTPPIFVSIGQKHRLTGIYSQYAKDSVTLTFDFTVSYPAGSTVAIPPQSQSILTLVDNIKQFTTELESINTGELLTEYQWLDFDSPLIQSRLASTRNQRRRQDLKDAARALEMCSSTVFNQFQQFSTSPTFTYASYVDAGYIDGPFAQIDNPCLQEDIAPADADVYEYAISKTSADENIWAYALCTLLEPESNNVFYGNSHSPLGASDYVGGRWQTESYSCQETDEDCYYCVTADQVSVL